ncbi:unnamed protein product [Peronospora belbahrii]|nr:unnamed protein product [Peronospora belbahrii]
MLELGEAAMLNAMGLTLEGNYGRWLIDLNLKIVSRVCPTCSRIGAIAAAIGVEQPQPVFDVGVLVDP